MATVAMALSACSKEDTPSGGDVMAEFSTNLADRSLSRATDEAWGDSDAIGVFTVDDELDGVMIDGVAQTNMGVNLKYTRESDNNGGTKWNGGATAFRFKNPASTEVTFKAYYPYTVDDKISGEDKISGTIAVDATMQTAEAQPAFDFMYADKAEDKADGAALPVGSKDNPMIKFLFRHSMAKVIIVLKPDTDKGVTFEDVKAMVPTLRGLKMTGTFSLADGKVDASAEEVTPVVLANSTEDQSASTRTFVAIVPPQTAPTGDDAAELSIAAGSNTFRSAKILSADLLAGYYYTYTITVKKMELVIESCDIAAWKEGGSGTADAVQQ